MIRGSARSDSVIKECEHGDRCSQLPPSIQFRPHATAIATAAGNCELTLGLDRRVFELKVCTEDQLREGKGGSGAIMGDGNRVSSLVTGM